MPFPNFKNKHRHSPFFTPREFLDYLKRSNIFPKFNIPESVIFCYSRPLMDYIVKLEGYPENIPAFRGDFYLLEDTNNRIAVSGGFGIGAPAVVTQLEELAALGVKNFLSIGYAGALQKDLHIGDTVVCSKAIRDEGVSYHYAKPSKYAYPSKVLTQSFKSTLKKLNFLFSEGITWTVDAPYRETVEEARHYQKIGVKTVEMEASALFIVAKTIKVNIASAFTVSDSLAELAWDPQLRSDKAFAALQSIYKAAKHTLMIQ